MHGSVILPAKNEADALGVLLPPIPSQLPAAEIIVVDDSSTNDTARAAEAAGAWVLRHPYSLGNGAAVKAGPDQPEPNGGQRGDQHQHGEPTGAAAGKLGTENSGK